MDNLMQSDDKQILYQVREGMRVYDRDNKDIGTVDRVYFGAASDQAYERGQGPADTRTANTAMTDAPVLRDLANVFEPDNLPEELKERLLNRGFVRLNAAGIIAADRYILPEQIDLVTNKQVVLKVARDELIKT